MGYAPRTLSDLSHREFVVAISFPLAAYLTSELAAPFLGGDRNQVFSVVPGSGCLGGALSTQIAGEGGRDRKSRK